MTTVYSDSFTESGTTDVTAHVSDSGHHYAMWAGATPAPKVFNILGSVLGSGSGSTQVVKISDLAPLAKGKFSAQVNVQQTSAQSMGLVCMANADGTAAYLAGYLPSTQKWYFFRVGAALSTTSIAVQAGTSAYAINDILNIEFSWDATGGSAVQLDLVVNGSAVLSAADAAAGRITTAGTAAYWFSTVTASTNWFFNSASIDDLAAATVYTITSPPPRKVAQLDGRYVGNAQIVLAGTYTGVAPNQWRVVVDATNVTVIDWTAFTVAPAGGAFSQTITVAKQSQWLRVEVRDSGSGVLGASGLVGTGLQVVIDGQSWAYGGFATLAYAGDNTLTPDGRACVTGKLAGAGVYNVPAPATMNLSIAIANDLIAAVGCPVALVYGGWDASGLTVAGGAGAEGAGGIWMSGGAAGNALIASAAAISAAGGVAATVWLHGQGDAGAGVPEATYLTALRGMVALRRASLGPSHPYVIVGLGRNTATLTNAQCQAIRGAQATAAEDAECYRVDSIDVPLHTDGVHPTATGFTTLGRRIAKAILAALGISTQYRGPRMSSVTTVDASTYDINLALAVGSDITPSAGVTGVRALVAGAPVAVSSVTRQAASTVRVVLSAPAASTPTIDYLYGANPSISGLVRSNDALTTPMEWSPGVQASLPSDLSGNGVADDAAASGSMSTTPSALSGGAQADDATSSGALASNASDLGGSAPADDAAVGGSMAGGAASQLSGDAAGDDAIASGRISSGLQLRSGYRAVPVGTRRTPIHLAAMDIDEIDDVAFRVGPALLPGEAIASALISVEVREGVDASPDLLLVGVHQVSGTDILQRMQGTVPGVRYLIRIAVTLDSGRVLLGAAFLLVDRQG